MQAIALILGARGRFRLAVASGAAVLERAIALASDLKALLMLQGAPHAAS